ncbi:MULTISPECIES: uracil-DNA glycosylase [Janibacter]|uniref:uracil-DNA glycosylase n=1 Tax=Janibacter TaxID=53457 RepID=UPI00083370A1|nr:uracil-DNA glycosylase [Janibacter terrae]MBA4083421.1 uracil-DNA glycosylase [Kytococcus sp.]
MADDVLLPHPVTGAPFASPVVPGTGWPDDLATRETPVARTAAQVRRLAAGAVGQDELDARISVCRACPRLVTWREEVAVTKRAAFSDQPYWGRPVPALGPPDAPVLVVGLAPAAHGANRTGRNFTGDRSGDWLYAALHRAGYANQPVSWAAGDGLELDGVRIIAPVRCAPPQNKPTLVERQTCAPWLDADLARSAPFVRSIMCLGSIGWDATIAGVRHAGWEVPRPKPKFGHGARATLRTPEGREVALVGCYHVSQQNTFTGKLTESMLDEVIASL